MRTLLRTTSDTLAKDARRNTNAVDSKITTDPPLDGPIDPAMNTAIENGKTDRYLIHLCENNCQLNNPYFETFSKSGKSISPHNARVFTRVRIVSSSPGDSSALSLDFAVGS